jgi:hypothetical protein
MLANPQQIEANDQVPDDPNAVRKAEAMLRTFHERSVDDPSDLAPLIHPEAEMRLFEWLDDQTVLASANARYALERGGFAAGTVYWLNEFREGLIWSIRAFQSESAARDAYDERLGPDCMTAPERTLA